MSLNNASASPVLSIGLAPEILTAVVRHAHQVVAHSDLRIAAEDPDGGYDGALDTLRHYLGRTGSALRGAPLSVAVSTRWCQLEMLPWSTALVFPDSALRYRQAHFTAIYGELARHWEIVCEEAPFGQPRLACGIDAGLLAGVRAIALQHGHRLVAIESALSLAARRLAPERQQAIALIERHRLVLATLAHGCIDSVLAQASIGAWHAHLPQGWQSWKLCAPEAGEIAQVALISVDADRPSRLAHAVQGMQGKPTDGSVSLDAEMH
jgi:hypothetical protein